VRRRSCGASFSIPACAAAARTTSQITFGDIPLPQMRPALLIARKTGPSVVMAAAVHAAWRRRRVGYQTLINEVLAEHTRKDVA
jgi:hypothetical protein